jgi:formylglycine-generating enzyme required for sulfatase activity
MLITFDIFLLVSAILSFPFLIWSAWKNVRMAKTSLTWPSVRGVVTASFPLQERLRTQPGITYSYSVNGVQYSGNRVSFAPVIPSRATGSMLARYPTGQSVDVRYAPDEPTQSVLEPGVTDYVFAPLRNNLIRFGFVILVTGFWPFHGGTQARAPVVAPIPRSTPVGSPSFEQASEFGIQQAAKHQPWVNSLGMRFVPVPGTQIWFSIWDTRVQDFKAFVNETRYDATKGMWSITKEGWKPREATWESPGFTQGWGYPVVGVSWNDAKAFCAWLTKKEHAVGQLPKEIGYRLPTDNEWSVAVGLGYEDGNTPQEKDGGLLHRKLDGIYPWGREWPPPSGAGNYFGEEAEVGDQPWAGLAIRGYNDGWPRTSQVGAFTANRFGLYDMGGNVWQWCEDLYGSDGVSRVLRGGSWAYDYPWNLRSARRNYENQGYRRDHIGFRCVVAMGTSQ